MTATLHELVTPTGRLIAPPGLPREQFLANRCQEMAKIHATLALAAATALNDAEGGMPHRDFKAWHAVAGASPAASDPGPPAVQLADGGELVL